MIMWVRQCHLHHPLVISIYIEVPQNLPFPTWALFINMKITMKITMKNHCWVVKMALFSPHETGAEEPQEPRLRSRPAAGSAYSVPSTNPTGRRKVRGALDGNPHIILNHDGNHHSSLTSIKPP